MKPFAWSYSKYKNYDTCPKRHYEVDLAKNFTDTSDQLTWGNAVHDGMRDACLGKAKLPDSMKDYQHWADDMADVSPAGVRRPGKLFVEQQLAMAVDFTPTTWFGQNAWFRGIVDAARLNGDVALARDWKTGKILEDSRQLMLLAQVLFVHHPELKAIKTEFVWLKEDCKTGEWFFRDRIACEWPPILSQVRDMEEASRTMNYPPKPGRLCTRFCPVISCPYHGKRHS